VRQERVGAAMIELQELLDAGPRRLMELLLAGHAIDPGTLDDTLYRGVSLGLPTVVEKLTWTKFGKTFCRDPRTGHLRGWNVRMQQDELDEPWSPSRERSGAPRTFGHYRVVDPASCPGPAGTDRGLLIHYGLGGNKRRDPLRRARDPIVAVNPDDPTLLLGWTWLDLLRPVGTPSFFSLELDGPLDHRADPPRRPPA
jgi:hypothetical protein